MGLCRGTPASSRCASRRCASEAASFSCSALASCSWRRFSIFSRRRAFSASGTCGTEHAIVSTQDMHLPEKMLTCCSRTTSYCVPAQHRIRSRLPMQLGALHLTPLVYLPQQPWCLPPAHAHPMPFSHVLLLPASQAHRNPIQRDIMQCSKQPSRAVSMEPATGHPCREAASCPAPKPICTFMACRLSDGREAGEIVPHPSRQAGFRPSVCVWHVVHPLPGEWEESGLHGTRRIRRVRGNEVITARLLHTCCSSAGQTPQQFLQQPNCGSRPGCRTLHPGITWT